MKERGILFSGSMPQALREGRKTQTRRPITRLLKHGEITEFGKSDTRGYDWHFRARQALWNDLRHAQLLERCPYGQPGDRLYVKENFRLVDGLGVTEDQLQYQADDQFRDLPDNLFSNTASYGRLIDWTAFHPNAWRSKLLMPKWAARIWLEVTAVRVERLQEISDKDAAAEGIDRDDGAWASYSKAYNRCISPVTSFRTLWESINGPGSWTLNPLVWAIEFKLLEGGQNP